MSSEQPGRDASEGSPAAPAQEPAWARRRRLAAIFGDVLPETTSDEREPERGSRSSEDWLRDQVPPHHGS